MSHTFILGGRKFTLRDDMPVEPFLASDGVEGVYEMVCSCVSEREQLEETFTRPEITVMQLDGIADWITELVSERPIESASIIWIWARLNLMYIEGRLLLAGRELAGLSARRFFAVAYTLRAEEMGGRAALESWLDEVVAEIRMKKNAALMAEPTRQTEIPWDQADRMAVELVETG